MKRNKPQGSSRSILTKEVVYVCKYVCTIDVINSGTPDMTTADRSKSEIRIVPTRGVKGGGQEGDSCRQKC